MADVYEYARTVEVPPKSRDPLANITIQRFNEAVRWQSQELVGDRSLKTVLRECYDQFNGNLSCRDQEIADEIGVDAYVNLSAMKAGLVQSFLMETLVQASTLPFTISPTPIPTLSESAKYEILAQIQQEIFQNNYSGDLQALVYNLKRTMLRKEYDHAKRAAEAMEKLMIDQCLEGRWNTAMFGFSTDFTVYPFAVLHGPVPVRRPRLQWSGDKLHTKVETFYEFYSVSPWDFWYSPDSPDTQRGTGIFIRQRWTRQKLLEAAQMRSYIQSNIMEVLKGTEGYDYNFKWMSANPDQPDDQLAMWANCSATVDVLIHYGYFSGKELKEYHIRNVEDTQFYNAMITVINGITVQVVVPPNPNLNIRPVHTASFYKTHDRIPSFSIPQRIRDVERCYLTTLRYLISNASSASGPITEADYARLSKYMTDEDLGKLIPNTVYLADSEIGTNTPALRFYSIPSVMGQYMQVLQYFMDLVDRISNIPAALHGTAQGSGVNRTFRGAAMLQGNATKSIKAAMGNIDHFVFEPMGQLLYNYNMVYHSDESIKGDCKVLAQGSTGLLQREIDRQNSYEILQLTAAAGNQLTAMPNGAAILTWALNNVLGNMGVPSELLSQAGPQTPGPTGMAAPGPAEPSMPAQEAAGNM
ncbi:MAG: hypothetical protein IJA20_02600 [Methanocorpusculum sp.]|nr:hypothetical protein [Methanocorpusculum sp.]